MAADAPTTRPSPDDPESRLAVCSWSLEPRDAPELASRVRAAGVARVQLALDPVRTGVMPLESVRDTLAAAGIGIASGMMAMAGEDYSTLDSIRRTGGVVADAHWSANRSAAIGNARIARELDIGLVTFHAGFIPHDRTDPVRAALVRRVRELRDLFGAEGVRIALETGQERAGVLLELLADLPDVAVNFDPANMILYGMGDPVLALRELRPHVAQVHIKDAVPPAVSGTWGREVPVGRGAVDWAGFFRALQSPPGPPACVIERESGSDRLPDIREARDLVRRFLRRAPAK